MLKHTDEQVEGEEEVKDLRDHRWCSHQEVVRFELERMHEPVSQMKVQRRGRLVPKYIERM